MRKTAIEMHEGPEAFERVRKAVKAVMGIKKSALPPKPHRKQKKATKHKA